MEKGTLIAAVPGEGIYEREIYGLSNRKRRGDPRMNHSSLPFRGVFLLLLPCMLLLVPGAPAESAGLPQYCQYPPYVLQSVLPSVTLLVSNSVSMLQFAYGDNVVPTNPCDNQANACGGFD